MAVSIGNYVPVVDAASTTILVKTGFDQSLPVVGAQFALALTSSTALTVPSGATTALVQAVGTNVAWRDDGSAPTPTTGFLLFAGGAPQVFAGNLAAVRFIQVSATATLNVLYYT